MYRTPSQRPARRGVPRLALRAALRAAFWAAFWAAFTLALGGCGGGGGGAGDDGSGGTRGDPDEGMPSVAGLRFVVAEDTTLDGVLSDATRPGESVSGGFGLLSRPAHGTLELAADGRGFRFVPEPDFAGTDGFGYTTADGRVLQATIDVTPEPDAPELIVPDRYTAERGVPFVATLGAYDADGDALRFEANGLPAWLTLDASSGRLGGTPGAADVGIRPAITLAVVDPSGRRDERTGISVEVVDPGGAPGLALDDFPTVLDARERREVAVLDAATDPGGATLAVQADPALSARVDGGRVTLEASDVDVVTEAGVTLLVTDAAGRTRREVRTVTLRPLSASGRGHTLLGGTDGSGVDLVVLGDGYRSDQQALLRDDALGLVRLLESDPGTVSHLAAFNVHVLDSVSLDAGADDGEVDVRDTLFDSRYGCRGIPRLICADTLVLFDASLDEYPDLDQLVLLVNDARPGGSGNSGGSVAIAARGVPEIALHEMGHSLAGLADEYVDSTLVEALAPEFVEGRYPNVSSSDDPARVPWAHWIDDPPSVPRTEGESGVGVFEGALYRESGLYRPTSTSRMREYARPFGPVNSERWVLGLYRMTNTVRAFAPIASRLESVAGNTQRFSVEPFFGADVQAITWSLNGERVREADGAHTFDITPQAGLYHVRLSVVDVSGLIRLPPPHEGVFEWEWEVIVR